MEQTSKKKRDSRLIAGLWLVIGPTALLITAFILYAIAHWLIATGPLTPSNPLGEASPVTTGVDVIFISVGVLCTLAWLPALITGIVLLATRKHHQGSKQ